uniref:Uncharacterized protein n=1 Tax=Romanomermis culicivorax TaxID=13658 RepID=A0A915IX78_ROMCU
FRQYGFVPEEYNTPALFPHDSLEAAEIDHPGETLIAAFHNVALTDVLPSDAANKIYPTISPIALPAIMRDKVLSAYEFFMFNCTSSDYGPSFCLGTVPNNPKCLQADITSAMKGRLMDRLIELLNFLVSPMYKLAIHDHIQFDPDLALPPIPHEPGVPPSTTVCGTAPTATLEHASLIG